MTAPGNSALLLILVAVFVACAGYAAGRLHQRFQTEQDREEAYRDGYDTATRSIFGTAARLIAPRRSGRVAAARPVLDGAIVTDQPVAAPVPAPPAAENDAESLGFPVPPRPPSRIVGEPRAVGGVVYRPFPDPRLVGGSEPLPADRGSLHLPPADPGPIPAEPGEEAGSAGRHTVPDELVQAATYRLPPDRVFRARVPDGDGPDLPDEPTTRLSVPKPRQS